MKIETSKKISPLFCWDIYCLHHFETLEKLKKERDIKTINSLSKKEKWNNNINTIFKNQEFDALVITDLNQKIIWVNEGFTKMTGYSKKFAVDKTPHFLQGENTSPYIKEEFRTKLNEKQPFITTITNYKKDNTPYNCEVKIIPLYCNKKVTHFIALEKEVS